MADEFLLPGMGLGGFLLSMNTMLMLEKKGLLTAVETKEIVEQALLNLETHEAMASPAEQPGFRSARTILEGLRLLLGRPSPSR